MTGSARNRVLVPFDFGRPQLNGDELVITRNEDLLLQPINTARRDLS